MGSSCNTLQTIKNTNPGSTKDYVPKTERVVEKVASWGTDIRIKT